MGRIIKTFHKSNNAFLDNAHAGSNIVKQLKKRPYTRSKGYVFRYIQDIDNEKLNN